MSFSGFSLREWHIKTADVQKGEESMNLPLNIDFTGKVVVITGAGGVLCGTMVRAFAQAGAKVAALDLNEEAVKKIADECKAEGYICEGYKANVLEAETLKDVHAQIVKDLGVCDILINGAGGNNPRATTDNEYHHEASEGQKTFFDLDTDGVDFVFKLNFQGTLIPTQIFAKDMAERKAGCILNISSMNAYTPLTKIPAYSAAKSGISNFTQWLATHFAGTGIRCNAIAPGFIDTEMTQILSDQVKTAILDQIPMKHFGSTKDIANTAAFLASDDAGYITGQVISVDGGMAM